MMEYDKNVCPVVEVDGMIAAGKQFDLDIRLPEDNRNVIYGVIRDCYGDPVCDAVVKLIEVVCECGKEERRPVSHTFTDKEGEFVFGPLCANKFYAIEIWVDQVKHCKICTDCKHEGKCLKGVKLDCKHDFTCEKHCEKKCEEKCEEKCEKKCEKICEEICEKMCEKKCEEICKKECEEKCEKPCCRPCYRPCGK